MNDIFNVTLLDLTALKKQIPKNESSAHGIINELTYTYTEYRIIRRLYLEKRGSSIEANDALFDMLIKIKYKILLAHDSIFDIVVKYYV